MKLLDDYTKLRNEIFAYFGYVEDWRVLPLDDARSYYWRLDQETHGGGEVAFAETVEELDGVEGNLYVNTIYTNRHLPKWVYRGAEYTMICVDTQTDGNQFLQIFDNRKEVP